MLAWFFAKFAKLVPTTGIATLVFDMCVVYSLPGMIYTAIDTFYLTDEQLKDSPSRKDGIDEDTETTLRIYGCDLIQESGILLRLYPLLSSLQVEP